MVQRIVLRAFTFEAKLLFGGALAGYAVSNPGY